VAAAVAAQIREKCDMAQFIGKVIGTKMQKTAKVEVIRMFLHPQVLKVVNY